MKSQREDEHARIAAHTSARLPMMPESHDKKFVDENIFRADVPCGSCTLCCRTLIVPLADEEYEQYEGYWAWITDAKTGERYGRALKRNSDGSCVFLGEKGCTIHGRAPHVCQRFDCRELFSKSDRAGRRQAVKSGKLPKSLFDRGHELIEDAGRK